MRRSSGRLLCAIGIALATRAVAADRPYEFGVLPYLPPAKIQELYGPIAADFEAKLGRQIWFSTKSDYALYQAALEKGTYDIAFVQPFDYVDVHDTLGYLPLARRTEYLQSLIVVRPDSPLKSIKDLKGMIVANPPETALVSRLTGMALQEAGIDPVSGVTREYGKNHFTCMQSVLIRAADACGTAEQALLHFQKEKQMTNRFRILHRTRPLPPPLFVVHPRVPRKDREILLKTIVDWPNTKEGRKILSDGDFIPFTTAQDSDYDPVRRYVRAAGKPQSR